MNPSRITLDSPDLAARRRLVARQAMREQRRVPRQTRQMSPVPVVSTQMVEATVEPDFSTESLESQNPVSQSNLARQFDNVKAAGKRPARARVPRNIFGKAINVIADTPYMLRHRMTKKSLLIHGLSLFFISLGISVVLIQKHQNQNVVAIAQAQADTAISQSTEAAKPAEAAKPKPKPKPIQYAPNQPKRVKIGSIKVNAPMIRLGTAKDGSIDTPYDVSLVGWYAQSQHPGEDGVMIFDGHVGEPGFPGVFGKLSDTKKGDDIEVEQGDGKKFTYTVVQTKVYNNDSYDRDDFFKPVSAKPGLNIITCNGTYDKKSQTYDHRLVVYAELKG